MPNRTNVPTPPANQARSTLQVVSWTASTDQYTSVVDLNDGTGTSWQIVPGTLKLGTPEKKYVESDNIRAPGTSVVKQQYGNMKVSATFTLRGTSYADIIAKVRALVGAVDNPKATPYALRIALPSATQYSYAWVLKCKHDVPLGDTRKLIQQALTGITIVWDCAPGYLGDRLTLQNLAVNPGFEAPMGGGTATTAPLVFSDTLANFNAYTVQAGGALSQDTLRYTDVVQGDGPRRYLRFGEASGTTAFEVIGANNGTIAGGVTLGVAGAIVGSADTAYTFNGSTGKVTIPTALMPTGNGAFSMECWFKFAANPASAQIFLGYGDTAHTSKAFLEFQLQTTGAVVFNCGANSVSSAVLTTGVYHHLLGTYDGTTMTFYVDGASVGTPQTPAGGLVIPASPTFIVGCSLASAAFFSGQVDEVAAYGSALSAARASAHFTAGHNAPTATANTMVIPAAGRVSFGSANWSAMQNWQVRFRFLAGGTYSFYLHYTDANNNLQAQVTSTQLKLIHTVGGVANTLVASAAFSVSLQTEVQYWVQVTQFPTVAAGVGGVGDPPYLTAALFVDSGGAMSSQYATIAAPAFDAVTAETGQPQMAASGAALGIGGAFSNVNAVSLFGPGAWFVQNSGTGTAAGSWEQNASNTVTGGPVTSFGAARLDVAPAGTLSALWTHYAGGTPAGTNAIQATAGQIVAAAAQVKSSGLGVSATLKLNLAEYDSLGNLLRTTTLATLTGNQASWTSLAGTLTLGTFTAYVAAQLAAADASAGSAGATVWWDNAQLWNKTTTAQDSMPYCELRFPNSPATLMVSGLQGDLPAPAWLAAGTYLTSWPTAGTLRLALGRRPRADARAQLAAYCNGFYGTALAPQATAALDGNSYGGFEPLVTLGAGWNPRAFSPLAGDAPGLYHLLSRFISGQSSGNLANQTLRVSTVQGYLPWYGALNFADELANYYGPFTNGPLAPGGAWQVVDAGLCPLPPFPSGGLADLTQTYVTPHQEWVDSSGVSAAARANWNLLLPVDGSLLMATVNNPSNAPAALTNVWLWVYADPLAGGGPVPSVAAWLYSQANAPQGSSPNPQPSVGAGSVGTQTTGLINVNPAADPFLTVDPELDTGTAAAQLGVNQFGAVIYDQAGAVLPLLAELQYTPTYLYPR